MSKLTKALTAAAGNAGGDNLYVEDVFSTYLYEGNGSTQTITNGIDLDGEGGLVWFKKRNAAVGHQLIDTARGDDNVLGTESTAAESNIAGLTTFTSSGFTLDNGSTRTNNSGDDYASWTFRKAEKFFDVVTYTGTGGGAGTGQTIAHSLDSTPACMIVKNRTTGSNWTVYHKDSNATPEDYKLELNGTGAAVFNADTWNRTAPTSTHFTIGNNDNASGDEYVAYLFASDAGGFGDDGSESIIKCGSYSGGTPPVDVNLGWEPQFVLVKRTDASDNWNIEDIYRGLETGGNQWYLVANYPYAENNNQSLNITATGFRLVGASNGWNNPSGNYIYIAIRRPMKTPESGTEVYTNVEGSGADPAYVSGFVTDLGIRRYPAATQGNKFYSRLTGLEYLDSTSAAAKVADSNGKFDYMDAWFDNPDGSGYYGWSFKRATGFFDVVAYSGDSVAGRTVSHNLRVVPELMIVKRRSASQSWYVYNPNKRLQILNTDVAEYSESITAAYFGDGSNVIEPTSTQFTLSDSANVNTIGQTYISYHFATLAGVSKVGSYTGTGANLNVDCGFSAGARFILIKRTDSTGDWYVWDSVRGIVAGNDPYLLLNSTAAEVTSTDYIDPLASGFTVTSSAPAALNASGGTYIFLAIA